MQDRYRVLETRTALGVFPNMESAYGAIDALLEGGFDEEHISLVTAGSGTGSVAASVGEGQSAASDSPITSLQRIPDEALYSSGPMISRLSGPAFAANMGPLAGAIVGSGIPPALALDIEARVQGGRVLVTYICRNDLECTQVPQLFQTNQAELVACTPAEGYAA